MRAAKARWTDERAPELQPFLRDLGLVAVDDVLHANLPTQPPFCLFRVRTGGHSLNMATNIIHKPSHARIVRHFCNFF